MRKKDNLTCKRPDRHVPGIVCGYPIPCPHHTIVLNENEIKDEKTFKRAVTVKTARKSVELARELLWRK